jgi:thioredoxin 1
MNKREQLIKGLKEIKDTIYVTYTNAVDTITTKKINFDETINNSKGKVVVDCYADWCGPCKMLAPIIEEISEELNTITFYKLNVDENEETSNKFQIMTIPTILIFNDGKLISQTAGFMTKDMVLELINGK